MKKNDKYIIRNKKSLIIVIIGILLIVAYSIVDRNFIGFIPVIFFVLYGSVLFLVKRNKIRTDLKNYQLMLS